jgi:MurNAc alpha-1-phosphate uridylyltransferase
MNKLMRYPPDVQKGAVRLVFDSYPQGSVFSLVQPIHELIGKGGVCRGLLHRGNWFDIGRPLDLIRANRVMGGR